MQKIFKSKIVNSLFWVAVEKFGYSGIYFVSTLVLARLLTPTDYGIIGVLAVFISFSQMLVESGLGGALVKKDRVSKEDYNTIFTFNIGCSVMLYIILFSASPYIADFYKNGQLNTITRVVGLNIIFSALTLTQRIHLIRELQFRKQSLISICALFVSVVISIFIAYKGFGVWALVFQQLFYNIFYFLFVLYVVQFKPKLQFCKESFKELYGFGSKLFLSSLLTILYNEGISSLIAKIYGLTITGLYYQAKKLVDFPINIFRAFGDNVVFPMLSRETDGEAFFKKSSLLMRAIITLSLPIFIILYFYSKEVVMIVLGKQWLESAKMLHILCLSSVAFVIDTVSRNILKATGNGNAILKSEVIKKIIGIALIISFISFNLNVFLYSIVVGNLIGCFVNMIYVNILTKYTFLNQIKDVLPVIAISIISGFLGKYSIKYFSMEMNADFVIGVLAIFALYTVLCLSFVIDRNEFSKLKK
jgi:O-antigen/teichoic acid export membrane protein